MKPLQDRINAKARMYRRSSPIRAYLGSGNGSGKSMMMVYDIIPSLEQGREVLSTVRLLDYKNPRPCDDPTCSFPGHPDHQAAHPNWVPLISYEQLLNAKDTCILLDEVTGVVNSREYNKLPAAIANKLVQLRRDNCTLSWTATNWSRCDVIVRELTQTATLVLPLLKKRVKPKENEPLQLWRSGQLFYARTFDAALLDEFDARGADLGSMKPKAHQLFYRPWGYATKAYDTMDAVLSLGDATDLGTCITCGGKRLQTKCSCADHQLKHFGKRAEGVPQALPILDGSAIPLLS
jgi:hypothetical protein